MNNYRIIFFQKNCAEWIEFMFSSDSETLPIKNGRTYLDDPISNVQTKFLSILIEHCRKNEISNLIDYEHIQDIWLNSISDVGFIEFSNFIDYEHIQDIWLNSISDVGFIELEEMCFPIILSSEWEV